MSLEPINGKDVGKFHWRGTNYKMSRLLQRLCKPPNGYIINIRFGGFSMSKRKRTRAFLISSILISWKTDNEFRKPKQAEL